MNDDRPWRVSLLAPSRHMTKYRKVLFFVFSTSSFSSSCSSSSGEDKTFRTRLLDTFVLVIPGNCPVHLQRRLRREQFQATYSHLKKDSQFKLHSSQIPFLHFIKWNICLVIPFSKKQIIITSATESGRRLCCHPCLSVHLLLAKSKIFQVLYIGQSILLFFLFVCLSVCLSVTDRSQF